jgi:VanZ family protein
MCWEPNCRQSVRRKAGKKKSPQLAGRPITLTPSYCTYIPRQAISALAGLTLCGILFAGLWPFHSPKNQVHWQGNQNGLRFDRYGTILSSGEFESASSDRPSCSLEIWLKPARTWGTGTFLAFYAPLRRREFSLQQDYIDLALQRRVGDEGQSDLNVNEVFRRKQALITITSDGQDMAVYVDGSLVTRSRQFGLSLSDLGGQLIAANSPLQSNSWSGQLLGLAIYKGELTTVQVARHYLDWTQKGSPAVAENDPTLALYLFDEHSGKIIHNQVKPGLGLYIPDRYLVVHQTFLESPWKEFQNQKSYLKNALINVAGFVPLGFCFGAYFVAVRPIKHATLATIVFGAIVSLTIEVLQSYLPTRDSGVTDLVTNTFGTGLGVALYHAAALALERVLAARPRAAYFGIAQDSGTP